MSNRKKVLWSMKAIQWVTVVLGEKDLWTACLNKVNMKKTEGGC